MFGRGSSRSQPVPVDVGAGGVPFPLWTKGRGPVVEVAGVSFHEAALRRLFTDARQTQSRKEWSGIAVLLPEPGNAHDRNAVQVLVGGQLVGYLPKEIAAGYAPVMTRLVGSGFSPTAECQVVANQYEKWVGTDRHGKDVTQSEFSAWVTLRLEAAHLCVPPNLPPPGRDRLLPPGSALQVRGEEQHLDVLAPLVPPVGETWVYATLVAVPPSARTGKGVIEVQVDGQPIGQLTPGSSAHFLPTVRRLDVAGLTAGAQVLLHGNAIKVEAVLFAAKAHELSAAWLAGIPAGTPLPTSTRPELEAIGTPAAAMAPGSPVGPTEAPTPQDAVSTPVAVEVEVAAVDDPVIVPPKPSRVVFNPPPGWPAPPEGFEPPVGWTPLPEWPRPPLGWSFWVTAP